MMGRPWLFAFGPFLVQTEAREELNMIATGLEPEEYVEKIWAMRFEMSPKRQKARSRSWPMTIRVKGRGFVLGSNQGKVLRLPTRLRTVKN